MPFETHDKLALRLLGRIKLARGTRIALNTIEFTALVGLGALLAGFLGALTGLGGGVVIVPLLTLVFGVDIHYAIGAALVSVIATSSGAAAAYVREGYSRLPPPWGLWSERSWFCTCTFPSSRLFSV